MRHLDELASHVPNQIGPRIDSVENHSIWYVDPVADLPAQAFPAERVSQGADWTVPGAVPPKRAA
jgi:hypothetical protein